MGGDVGTEIPQALKSDQRYVAAKSVTSQERDEFVHKIKENPLFRSSHTDINPERYPGLQDTITQQLQRVNQKLAELGIENTSGFVPIMESIRFKATPGSLAGFNDPERIEITLFLPERGLKFPNEEFNFLLYHEAAHFMKKMAVAKRNSGKLAIISAGFSMSSKHIYDLYEESSADLFALFCQDKDITQRTSYAALLSFLIPMLEKFAQVKGIDPANAFKRFFKADMTQDFSFQKEMVDVFGKEAVRAFNNYSWWERRGGIRKRGDVGPIITLEKLAEIGGFVTRYNELESAFDQGKEVGLPGLKGSFVASYPKNITR